MFLYEKERLLVTVVILWWLLIEMSLSFPLAVSSLVISIAWNWGTWWSTVCPKAKATKSVQKKSTKHTRVIYSVYVLGGRGSKNPAVPDQWFSECDPQIQRYHLATF